LYVAGRAASEEREVKAIASAGALARINAGILDELKIAIVGERMVRTKAAQMKHMAAT
jgi:hypothetical protein